MSSTTAAISGLEPAVRRHLDIPVTARSIRVGGPGKNRSALQVAEQRNYRDFRDDAVIQIRQFQVALKKLRLLSCREDGPKTELNVEKTIEKTCDEGGRLELVMERPRKNQTKLLLLMDSGGSMWAYADLVQPAVPGGQSVVPF